MTNAIELRKRIKNSVLKLKYIAENLSLTPYGLQRKIDNFSEFKASEIRKMCNLLGISDSKTRDMIFFDQSSDLKSLNL